MNMKPGPACKGWTEAVVEILLGKEGLLWCLFFWLFVLPIAAAVPAWYVTEKAFDLMMGDNS